MLRQTMMALALCALAMAWNVAGDTFLPGFADYLKRRYHYEFGISDKGLSMHPARHWRKEPGATEEGSKK